MSRSSVSRRTDQLFSVTMMEFEWLTRMVMARSAPTQELKFWIEV